METIDKRNVLHSTASDKGGYTCCRGGSRLEYMIQSLIRHNESRTASELHERYKRVLRETPANGRERAASG